MYTYSGVSRKNTLGIYPHRVIHDVWWCRNTACTHSKERYEAHSQGTIEASNNKICLGVHLHGIFLPQPCSVPCELPAIHTVDGKFQSKLSRNTDCTQKADVHFQILELCICDIVLERRNIEGEAKGYNCSTHIIYYTAPF